MMMKKPRLHQIVCAIDMPFVAIFPIWKHIQNLRQIVRAIDMPFVAIFPIWKNIQNLYAIDMPHSRYAN